MVYPEPLSKSTGASIAASSVGIGSTGGSVAASRTGALRIRPSASIRRIHITGILIRFARKSHRITSRVRLTRAIPPAETKRYLWGRQDSLSCVLDARRGRSRSEVVSSLPFELLAIVVIYADNPRARFVSRCDDNNKGALASRVGSEPEKH